MSFPRAPQGRRLAAALALLPAAGAFAQTAGDAAPAASAAMTVPAMTGPLAANPDPLHLDAGALGTWYVTGAVSGLALAQDHRAPGDRSARGDLANGQVFVQKTAGLWQFFVQAGSYAIPALGTPYLPARKTGEAYYDAVPQAFVKFAPSEDFSLMAGKLPTMFGAEYTFTFENMNIERGLLWNQENAVANGVQATYAHGPLTAALSVNDGFYSHRYSWVTGLLSYAFDKNNTLSFVGGGNTRETARTGTATPLLQNNGQIYNVIYTHLAGAWTLTPYLQYTRVPSSAKLGIPRSASTLGGALLASYAFDSHFSLAGRAEYIRSSGSAADGTPNLLYGPGSKAWSLTLTPTWQYGLLFVRGELSYVKANGTTPGYALGRNLDSAAQSRAMLEAGILF
jgi:hypothetical protein